MNIQLATNEDLTAQITIQITPEDYTENLDKELKKQQKKVNIKGFRPGKAPMGMVSKMYKSEIMSRTIGDLLNQGIKEHLEEKELEMLASPIEQDTDKQIDFDKDTHFEFAFELGLRPKIEPSLSKDDVLTQYQIEMNEALINKEIESLCAKFATPQENEKVEKTSLITMSVSELDSEGNAIEEGIHNKEISVLVSIIKDEKVLADILNKKTGEVFTYNLLALFNDNKSVLSKYLEVTEEVLDDVNPDFQISISKITSQVPMEVGQELFDKVLGEGAVDSEEAFREKVQEGLKNYLEQESVTLLNQHVSKLIDTKHPVENMPVSYIEKLLKMQIKEELSEEEWADKIQNEVSGLTRMIVYDALFSSYELKLEEDDIKRTALNHTYSMFKQYGIPNPDMNMVAEFASKQLQESQFRQQVYDMAQTQKVVNEAKNRITIQEEVVSEDAFYEIVNKERG